MRRVVLFLLVLLAAGLVDLGGRRFRTAHPPSQSAETRENAIKNDIEKPGSAVSEPIPITAGDGQWLNRSEQAKRAEKNAALSVDEAFIQVETGSRASVKVRRVGQTLPKEQLATSAEPGSKLVISGGEFKEGERETTLTIEAPVGATGGEIRLQLEGGRQTSLDVEVTQPASIEWPADRIRMRL